MWSDMDLSNGDTEMQAGPLDVSTEQLEKMFHKNMSLSDRFAKASSHQNQPAAMVEEIEENPTPFKYSISQHYTHTSTMLTPETNPAHVVPALHPLQPLKQDIASRILIKNGISPSALLRSQLSLFEEADDEQKSRLIELWSIVNPTYARNGGQGLADGLGGYQTTTVGREEQLAWLRLQTDAGREEASSTGNYPNKNQHCPGIMDQPFDTNASGFGNSSQAPWKHQQDQTPHQPTVNNDIQDEEMF